MQRSAGSKWRQGAGALLSAGGSGGVLSAAAAAAVKAGRPRLRGRKLLQRSGKTAVLVQSGVKAVEKQKWRAQRRGERR